MKTVPRNSLRKKVLAFLFVFALLATTYLPSLGSVAFAGTRPTFERKYFFSYVQKSNLYTLLNVEKGYSVKWTISDDVDGYVSFSKTDNKLREETVKVTKDTTSIRIYTSADAVNILGQAFTVKAYLYNAEGKRVTICSDRLNVSIDATSVSIVATPADNTLLVEQLFDFDSLLDPVTSTNKTYWLVTDESNQVIVDTKNGLTNDYVRMSMNGEFWSYVPGTFTITAVVYRCRDAKIVRATSEPVTIKVIYPPTPTPTPTPETIPYISYVPQPTATPFPTEPTATPIPSVTPAALTVVFHGTVYISDTNRDLTNNPSVFNATITLSRTDAATGITTSYQSTSADNGSFSMEVLPGTYVLTIVGEGYATYTNPSFVISEGNNELIVFLDNLSRSATLSGLVTIADEDTNANNNAPLTGITVTLTKLGSSTATILQTSTIENGSYSFESIPFGIYEVSVSNESYIPIISEIVINSPDTIIYNITLEAISSENSGTGTASGTIYNALTGRGVEAGLTLLAFKGYNLTTGDVVATAYTDSSGNYTIDLPAGNYTVYVVDNRVEVSPEYSNSYFNIKVMGNKIIPNQNGQVTPVLADGEIRIVLAWGATPTDLDSHLNGPTDSGTFHIYYRNMTLEEDAVLIVQLDVDDTSSYGPETTTIYEQHDGIYKFSIHDFSNRSNNNSSALANSGAQVKVYVEDEVYVFFVPNLPGTVWDVFQYNSETGDITALNEMYFEYEPNNID